MQYILWRLKSISGQIALRTIPLYPISFFTSNIIEMQSYQSDFYQTNSPPLQSSSFLEDGSSHPNQFGKTEDGFSPIFQAPYFSPKSTDKDNATILSQIKQDRVPERHAPLTVKSSSLSRLQTSPLMKDTKGAASSRDDFSPSPNEFPLSGVSAGSTSLSSPEGFASSSKSQSKRDRTRNHTPRPSNSFILYRKEKHAELMAQYKGQKTLSNNVISKIVASMWRSETPEVKAHFGALAEQEKKAHLLKYPDYKYRPRKSGATKKSPTSVSKKSPPVREKPIREEIPIIHHGHYQPMQWNMAPQLVHYPPMPMHAMDPHRMTMMNPTEVERGFEFMNNNRFGSTFENEFLPQDGLLSPEYGHSWPLAGPIHGVWDLEHTLEGRPE